MKLWFNRKFVHFYVLCSCIYTPWCILSMKHVKSRLSYNQSWVCQKRLEKFQCLPHATLYQASKPPLHYPCQNLTANFYMQHPSKLAMYTWSLESSDQALFSSQENWFAGHFLLCASRYHIIWIIIAHEKHCPFSPTYKANLMNNKLASLKATLVWNTAEWPGDFM